MRLLCSCFLLAVSVLAYPPSAVGGPVTVTFDSLKDGDQGATLATYLATYGITSGNVTPGTNLVIVDDRVSYQGNAFRASSPHNVLSQIGSNDPVSYTLDFAVSQDSLQFTRPKLIVATPSGVTHPAWQAYAFDAMGHQLDTVSEGLIASFSDVPAATFTLHGPDITSLRIDSQNGHFAAFSALLLDDLVLPNGAPATVPEPVSLVQISAGILCVCGYGRRCWKRSSLSRLRVPEVGACLPS